VLHELGRFCTRRRFLTACRVFVCGAQEAKSIGDEFLALEKYVNLNYMGFHKILVGGWLGGCAG
jgi:hypothetical protein